MDLKLIDFDAEDIAGLEIHVITMTEVKALFTIMAITNTKDINEKVKEKFGEDMEDEILTAISYLRKDVSKFIGKNILEMDKETLKRWYKSEE